MLLFDRGLFVSHPRIGIDVKRGCSVGFVSHAHFDHMAPHKLAFCSPVTAEFYQFRIGDRPVRVIEFGDSIEFAGLRMTLYPAGHVFGSAMLLLEQNDVRVLYTGDFRLEEACTAEPIEEIPSADVLIMESTFGVPKYSFPNRRQLTDELLSSVQKIISDGDAPVIFAYAFGKAQEVTAILTRRGITVYQDPEIFQLSKIYERLGQDLGDYRCYDGQSTTGAVLVLPVGPKSSAVAEIHRAKTLSVSGWANSQHAGAARATDYSIPLSDHADYPQLLQMVERVAPRRIYCTHGPKCFSTDLRQRGYDARHLDRATAYCLEL